MSAGKRHGGVAAAWAVLIGMGGTSVVYNVFHAVTHGQMVLALALLYGIAPVFAAACLSHIVAVHDGGWFMRTVAFSVMLGAMSLSIGATASVVAPAAGHLRWLFGAVLDAAALLALRVILDRREQDSATVSELEDARHRAAGAESAAAALEAELAAARAELQAVREAAPAPVLPGGTAGRSGRSANGGTKAVRSAPRTAPRTGRGTAAPDDVDMEARALALLATDLTMTGAELARQLDVTPGYGRRLRRRLTADESVARVSEHGEEA